MIFMPQYWMGRDTIYPDEFTQKIKSNGEVTVFVVDKLLGMFAADTGIILTDCASGWRPAQVNCATSNAAEHSRHITAEACDVRDTPNRDLARWCCKNQGRLAELGLWVERFEWTSKEQSDGSWLHWVHVQRVPPLSKRRFYIPSMSPAMAPRLPEQDQYNC